MRPAMPARAPREAHRGRPPWRHGLHVFLHVQSLQLFGGKPEISTNTAVCGHITAISLTDLGDTYASPR